MANPLPRHVVIMQVSAGLAITVVLVVVGVYVRFASGENKNVTRWTKQSDCGRSSTGSDTVAGLRQRYSELKSQMDALNKQLDTLKTIVPEEKETDEFIRLVQGAQRRRMCNCDD